MTHLERENLLKPFFSSILLIGGVIITIIIDQLLKYKIRSDSGFYICNKGISFSLGINPIFFWIVLFSFLLFIFIYSKYLIKTAQLTPFFLLALILIVGGALSNGIDRLFLGCVIDFISIGWSFLPIFNPADVAISLGSFLLSLLLLSKK
jgi:signal peptidase II